MKSGGVPRARGHGAYTYDQPGPWGKHGRDIGELLGGTYFGAPGKALGGKLGSYAHYIGKIFGSGDYATSHGTIERNNLILGEQIPQFGSDPGSVRVAHREFIGDVYSSATAGAFTIYNYAINPGNSSTFPWLSQLCGSTFQQYRVNGMVFEFRSMSTEYSTNVTLGSVVMATDYDSSDATFVNKQQMENTIFGVSTKPSQNAIHAIECARSQTAVSEQYIRPGTVPTGSDIRLYDLGRFSIAVTGVTPVNANMGELWVSYDISLFKEILTIPGTLIPCADYPLALATIATQPFTPAVPAVGTPLFDSIGLTFAANGLSFSFPWNIPLNSVWAVMANYNGTATAGATAVTSFMLTNGLVRTDLSAPYLTGYYNPNVTPAPGAVRTAGTLQFILYTGGANPANPPTVTTAAFITPISPYTAANLYVTMVNGSL